MPQPQFFYLLSLMRNPHAPRHLDRKGQGQRDCTTVKTTISAPLPSRSPGRGVGSFPRGRALGFLLFGRPYPGKRC
jgi:hypothetical protein